MVLVAYSDSEEGDDDAGPLSSPLPARSTSRCPSTQPPPKKRRISASSSSPPPLPASFHNLYSSSVRVSTSDDPSLHGGRKRIVPHIPGNWPTHAYLEWFPESTQHSQLQDLVAAVSKNTATVPAPGSNDSTVQPPPQIHSLLETPLGTPLPLHISLSAPLVLRTETKDSFLDSFQTALTPIVKKYPRGVTVTPDNLAWHTNEDGSRSFLVLRVLELPDRHGQSDRALSDNQNSARARQGRGEEQEQEQDHCTSQDKKQNPAIETELQHQQHHGKLDEDEKERLGLLRRDGSAAGTPELGSSSSSRVLNEILTATNRVAKTFGQPELYTRPPPSSKDKDKDKQQTKQQTKHAATAKSAERGDFSGYFHLSIAWALSTPQSQSHSPPQSQSQSHSQSRPRSSTTTASSINETTSSDDDAMTEIKKMKISFDEVKIRIGQDVTDLPFGGGGGGGGGGGAPIDHRRKRKGMNLFLRGH